MNIKIGTRKSPLALKQTEIVISSIKSKLPELEFTVVPIVTQGDRVLDRPLGEFGGKGVFVEEFEKAILKGEIDLAVHSAKDMPISLEEGLSIVYTPKRASHRDVLITPKGVQYSPSDSFTIGTGSIRREYQLGNVFPRAKFSSIRGNIGTRLDKLSSGQYDAIVLASAGLERMNITEDDYNFRYLTNEECLCSGCQGIITVEGLTHSPIARMLSFVEDASSRMSFEVERGVLKIINADCHECSGVHSSVIGDTIYTDVLFPNHMRRQFKYHTKEELFKAVKEYYYG